MEDAEQYFVRVVDFMIGTGSCAGSIRKKGESDKLFDDVVQLCKENMDAEDWTGNKGRVEFTLKEHGDVVIRVAILDNCIDIQYVGKLV
jgi:hypothetical protein